MICASCRRATKAGARFCVGCGASLAPRCPACGAESEPDARFCGACGAALGAPGAPRPAEGVARKVVTIVFADLVGSTALHERLDAEAVRAFMERYYAAMRSAVEAHGGRVTQLMGDGVKAVFGAPRVAEDDAIRAVRAAVEMQRAFRALADEQCGRVGKTGLRVAVNTGEVIADDATEIIGDPVNVAARLQEQGRDGDVVIGGSTQRLVGSLVTLERLGSFALKGRSEAVEAYRVVSLEAPAGAAATPFVGRDDELRRLTAIYASAITAPAARLAVLLGSPGLGKSRLLAELGKSLEGRAHVLMAHCSPSGGATFAPLAEALRVHLQRETRAGEEALRGALDALVAPGNDAERAQLAVGMDALLSGAPALPEEIFFVVRRLLSALAAERPVVLAIDDVQWAEPLLLDFTEHLVQWGAGVPLLVLVAARPELREKRSSFATPGGLVSEVVTLGGLDAAAAMRLAANVVGADTLPAVVAGRVLATSEGNPLFLRELVRMLVNDGALRREGERWVLAVELAALEMPPTIQALLAARIERLRPDERLVLERASVVGRRFSRAAVTHLLPREAQADLDARLEALRRSELIEADAGWLLGEPTLRFHHVLIRDAAYRRVLRGTRAELHARFADWLEARAGESGEHQETLGWHLEQAHQHLRELGPLDASGRALGERAGRHLAAAGQRALARDDLVPAANLLGRALDCLGQADPARGDLALDWCEALLSAGDVGTASRALAELDRSAAGSPRLRAWHTCFGGQLAALADPKALRASAGAVAAAAEALAAEGDVAGEAKAHAVHAEALARLGEIGACEAALDKALAAARRANDRRRANTVLAGAPLAALWGPSPVTRASGRCLDVVRVLRITQGAPAVEAVALRCQAVLETLRGRSEAARRMIASSRRLVEELGITQRLLEVDASAGLIELFEGDAVAAERWLRPAYEGFRAHGLGIDAARAAALLGLALLAQGRAAEAETLSHESEALAGDDFQAAIDWRGVRAGALAQRGEHAAAIELARAAVEIAAATDDLLDHAAARSALASALRAAGRSAEAEAEQARAIELWEQKGATLLAERARRGVAPGARAAPAPSRATILRRPSRRRVPRNHATLHLVRVDEAVAARDLEALERLLGDSEALDHTSGRQWSALELFRFVVERYMDGGVVNEPIAVLGPSLALARWREWGSRLVGSDLPIGPFELEGSVLIEADAEARSTYVEIFAPDKLGDAVVRLYERYAERLPDGPERTLAAASARLVAVWDGPLDADRLAAALAPSVEVVDHRTLGTWSMRGADALVAQLRGWSDVADDVRRRAEAVLALRSDALLARWTHFGIDRTSGGAYERPFLLLWTLGADCLAAHWELFDADREADALARFDHLTAEARPARTPRRRVRPNAATANAARINEAIERRDADAVPSLLPDGFHAVHHPAGTVLDREENLAWWRLFFADPDAGFRLEPVATLGESLALCRQCWSRSSDDAAFDVGPYQVDAFALIEADAGVEVFAADKLGDSVARLYERYSELLREGPEKARAAATARSVAAMLVGPFDPDRYAAAFASGIEALDHRTLGTHSGRGASALLEAFRAWLSVAALSTARSDAVLGLRSDALLEQITFSGTDRAGGGVFERAFIRLLVFAADGLVARIEWYDPDREADALARFDELTAEPAAARFANAAWRAMESFERCWRERDWDGVLATYHPAHEMDDRRKLMRLSVSGEDFFANERMLFEETSSRWHSELLATRGDRIALGRVRFTAEAGGSGPMAVEMLDLVEVDAAGRRVALVVFDPDDLDAAWAELDERYGVKTPILLVGRINARDWDGVPALLAPELVIEDHRRLGWATLHGPAAYIGALQALVDLAPDARLRFDHLEQSGRAYLSVTMLSGTREGGVFEDSRVVVAELDPQGRVRTFEFYDLDQLGAARARYAALAALVAPNAASAAVDRFVAAFEARDWSAVRALAAEGARFEDRRRQALMSGDADWWVGDLRLAASYGEGLHFRRTLVASAGDRICLERVLWAGGSAGGRIEIEYLWLAEVDERGRLVAGLMFDADDRRAAIRESWRRWLARNPTAAAIVAPLIEFIEASNERDRARMRGLLADDFVWEDHRFVGVGPIAGVLAYLESVATTHGLIRDFQIETLSLEAIEGHGAVGVERAVGTLADGGDFEGLWIALSTVTNGRITRSEIFDPGHLDAALARLAELRPDPLRIPPNAASRAMDRRHEAWQARDWDALRALASPDFRFEDRSRRALVSGDVEMWLENNRFVQPASGERELIGTAGDRVALERVLWKGGEPGGAPVEREHIRLIEVDAEGRVRASIRFDPDDRAAAFAEAQARFVAGEAAAIGGQAPLLALSLAIARHDWESLKRCLAPDAVFHDYRPLSFGELRGDQWAEALRVQVELAPDVQAEDLYVLGWNRHGHVALTRRFGTLRAGGPFENAFVTVAISAGDRVPRYEVFALADADRALARFEELCAAQPTASRGLPPYSP
jgi:class 3 adenylate cyclase/ketosteroid isomerase-like protein/tetratricopeptide (TPR) repeat protein